MKYLSLIYIFILCFFYNANSQLYYSYSFPTHDSIKIENNKFIYNHKHIEITPISKHEFNKYLKVNTTTSNNYKSIDTTFKIKAINDTLKFPLDNGKYIILTDTLYDINFDYVETRMNISLGLLKPYNYYLVMISYYETGEFLLINKANGNMYYLTSWPDFSPDNKILISISSALGYDLMPTGIQIWSIDNKKMRLKANFGFDSFQIVDYVWVSENTIAFKTNDLYEKNKYGLLTIKMNNF